jgi:ABC-type Fe3+/spermidine/putrescine transport system ATPase subunit
MSKTLSLKLQDDIFVETEEVIEAIHKPRNSYINDALSFYNKFMKRNLLKKRLKKESRLVSESSLEALRELELIEDKLPR